MIRIQQVEAKGRSTMVQYSTGIDISLTCEPYI